MALSNDVDFQFIYTSCIHAVDVDAVEKKSEE